MEANTTYDPYKYIKRWPVVGYKQPFLIQLPENLKGMMKTVSFRVPAALEETIAGHCRAMGVKKSEWMRNAFLHVLSLEQQWFDEQKK